MACSIIRNKETNEIEQVLASNGKESKLYQEILKVNPDKESALKSWAQVYTPSFKQWFGDWEKGEGSKVVDENGEPLLVYHGSRSAEEFDTFNTNEKGIFFTDKSEISEVYAEANDVTDNIYPVFLSLKNPTNVDIEYIDDNRENIDFSKEGYIADNNRIAKTPHKEFVVFDPNKIKSLFNQGTFSKNDNNIYLQKKQQSTKESNEQIDNKIKNFLASIGVNIQTLSEIRDREGNLLDAVAKADMLNKIIQVVEGKADITTLSEEAAHFFVEMLGENHPLYQEMLSQITGYKIYKQTVDEYKGLKLYKNADGTVNFNKIKKEAIGKLIMAHIIKNETGEEVSAKINTAKKWWAKVWDAIKKVFKVNTSNPFQTAAENIIDNDTSSLDVNKQLSDEEYLQTAPENKELNDFYNKVLDNAKRTVLDPNPDDRHYTFDGQRVATTVSTKAKEGSKIKDFTPEEKIINDQKKDWGLEGHSYVENYIKTNLIDENGYVKPFTDTPIATNLPNDIKSALNSYIKELISSYPPGTRFMLEVLQTNPKVQGLISSTVDFKAFVPDPKTGFKVDTLDWKFTTVSTKYGQEDISWFKSKEWKAQMGEYNKMDYSLGLKPNQVGKSRMIPFVLEYQYRKPGNSKSGLYPSTIQIADFKDLKNTKTYLLPVPTSAESTGNPLVDELVSSLSAYYEKLYSKPPVADVAEQVLKKEELNNLSAAIKRLQVSLDFKPLMEVASNFIEKANRILRNSIDNGFEDSNIEEIKSILDNILELKNSSEKFVDLDEIFLGDQAREDLSKADNLLLTQLGAIAASTKRLQSIMSALQADAVVELVAKKGFIEGEKKDKLKQAQIEMQSMGKTFNEGTKLSNNLIAIGSSMWLRVKNNLAIMFSKKMDGIAPAIIQLEKDAKAQGKTAFQLIGEVRNGSLRLIRKLSTEFFDAYTKAQEEKDKEFFLKNMDVEKYNKLASDYVKKRTEEIEAREYEGEEEDVYWRKENAITEVKNSVLINSKTFNGWDEFVFNKFFKESLIEENHYSPEYLKMSQNSSAKQVWDYFTSLNNLAKQMGYKSVSSSFFPLIEATMLSKLAQSNDKASQLKDFFTDFYTAKVAEEQTFSKLDPETNKLKLEIPKLFTRTNKSVEQLSTDLTKVASLWTQSLMEYQATKEFESTLLSLQQLNKSRGHIVVDPNTQSVVMEGGAPKVDRSSNKDDELFQAIINDYLYKMQESLNSFGNVQIGKLGNKLGTTEEDKEKKTIATKKIIQTADKLVQQIAVGLKPLVAIPNLIGVKLQSFINAGEFYRFREFEKNSLKAVSKVSLIEKALLHAFIPINENVALEKQREIAGKQGFAKWLSTWSFMDVMMSTNAYPEKRLQIANALSFFDNTTIIDGKLVNIRQYLKQQDAKEKYKPGADLKAIEKSFESRVKEMKEKQSIAKLAKIENDELVIPGVSNEEMAKYRTKIIEYGRNLTGQMNMDNKANYRRDTMFRSFMMFKNWIPKQIYVRGAGLKQNRELDNWDYGRTRAFLKVFTELGFRNIAQISDVVRATPKGLEILDRILEEKKQEHFRKTGEELEISKEEFYDLMRTHIKNQVKELEVLLGLFILFIAAKLAKPPDDEDDLAKNRYKWYMKLTNKIYDEIGFYYNPLSFDSITKGSVTPSLSILVKTSKFLTQLSKLGVAGVSGNDEDWEKAHPTKYFLNMVPIASQFNNDIIPYIFPELAKEEGIKVTEESRQR